jgi:hypothetical protein
MSNYRNILIEVSIENEQFERLVTLKDSPILKGAKKITLVNAYNSTLKEHLPKDVNCNDFGQVEQSIKKKLEELKKIIDPKEKLNWEIKVLFNKDLRNILVYTARELDIDLIITGSKGVDLSLTQNRSFSHYMLESCSSDLWVLKPHD